MLSFKDDCAHPFASTNRLTIWSRSAPCIRQGSGRILNIKVQRMGGLWPARQAHDLARAAGISCWLGTMPELGIASAQGLHLGRRPNLPLPSDVVASGRWFLDDNLCPPRSIT